MKKMFFLLLLTIICFQCIGQKASKSPFLMNIRKQELAESTTHLSLKSYLIARHEYKKASREKFIPTWSVDLLNGKGIHLFSVANRGFIPNMNIGARFIAGIKISI